MDISVLFSGWMILFFASCACFLLLLFFPRKRKSVTLPFGRFLISYPRKKNRIWQISCAAFLLVLVGFGLLFAGPDQHRSRTLETRKDFREPVILVLADLSGSVTESGTGAGTRLTIINESYREILKLGFPTGLIIYADAAYMARVPWDPNDDTYVVLEKTMQLKTVNGLLENLPGGTNTASAFHLAESFFEENYQENPKIVVLLSDLEDMEGIVLPAFNDLRAKTTPLSVYVIQAGSQGYYSLAGTFSRMNLNGFVTVEDESEFGKTEKVFSHIRASFGEGTSREVLSDSPVPFAPRHVFVWGAVLWVGVFLCVALVLRDVYIVRLD